MPIQQKKVVYLIYDVFWGLLPAAGATFRGSLFARPCGGFAASVWPSATPTHR